LQIVSALTIVPAASARQERNEHDLVHILMRVDLTSVNHPMQIGRTPTTSAPRVWRQRAIALVVPRLTLMHLLHERAEENDLSFSGSA
jgi:hypothetical protein